MFISLKWLKRYVDIDINKAKDIASEFTLKVAEIEDLIFQNELYEGIIVAKVLEISKIENTDKLFKCILYDGESKIQVITGAQNVKEGDFVPLAKVGAIIPSSGKKIEKAVFKGIESNGMLCSASELKYYNDDKGILILQDINKIFNENIIDNSKLKEGTKISDILDLNDVIIEIDNKSLTNRPDLWGHYGIAREISSIYGLPLKPYVKNFEKLKDDNKIKIEIEDKNVCPAYAVIHISNIKNDKSPLWLQKLLYTIGQRPISLLVDLTNFIMFDIGEPMHAFDTNKVNHTDKIKIRFPKDSKEKKVITLDGKERELTDKTLLILDNKDTPIALAGIMGLQNSEVDENTNSILLEIANFNQAIIRKASVNLKLRTEASQRFEKSLDPNFIELAYNKFIEELLNIQKNIKIESVNYKRYYDDKEIKIELTYDFIKNKLGKNIPDSLIKNILINLGFNINENGNILEIIVPSYRATKDISIKEDIVEEVGRIFGYINIEPIAPKVKLDMPHKMEEPDIVRKIKEFLCFNEGLTEVNNYPYSNIDLEKYFTQTQPIEMQNPIDEKFPILKMNLIPGLLLNANQNLKYFEEFGLFEVEKVFFIDEKDKFNEILQIAGLICKNDQNESIYYSRNSLINLFKYFNVIDINIKTENIPAYLHPFKSGTIYYNNELIGIFGEIHPEIISNFDIKKPVSIFLTDLNKIIKYKKDFIAFKKIPKIQSTKFDLAFIVDKNTYSAELIDIIKEFSNENYYISEILPFDVYYSKNFGEDKKSIAFSITVQPYEKSLTSDEINELINKIITTMKTKGYELRK